MKPVRTFHEQLSKGELAELTLDGWARERFGNEPVKATMPDQRRGIDRHVAGPDGTAYTLEYKADSQGHRTGKAFIETISVDAKGKPGWLFSSEADFVVYWLAGDGRGWVLDPDTLRERAWDWTRRFPVKVSSNPTYHSYGVLVPHAELDLAATETFTWKA